MSSDQCCSRNTTDSQSSFGMTDERSPSCEVGVSETFITFLIPHQQSKNKNIKYSSIKLINEVNIVNSVNLYQILSMVCGAVLGAQRKTKPKAPEHLSVLFRCVLGTLTFGARVSERYKKFDQYIAYGTIRGNMQQIHIEEGGPNEVVKTARRKSLF